MDPVDIGQNILWFFEGAFRAGIPLGLLLLASRVYTNLR